MRSVVCIARADGARGDDIGKLVAERLGFLYVDAEIVARAAARGGLDPAVVADAERRRSLVRRVLDAFAASGEFGSGSFGAAVATGEPPEEEVRALIREAIAETVARGRVVIAGHGASHTLEGAENWLRVFVTASPATRAARLAESDQIDRSRAERLVKESDAARADYLRRFYGVNEETPTSYDVVVNTDTLSVDAAAAMISQAASD
jgi:hypothetical protein